MLLSDSNMSVIRDYLTLEDGGKKRRIANDAYSYIRLMVEYILNKHYNQAYRKCEDMLVVIVEKIMLSKIEIKKIESTKNLYSYLYQLIRNTAINYIRDNNKLNVTYVGTYWDLSKVVYGYNELEDENK